jgi:exonuclease III
MRILSWNIMQGGGKRVRSIVNKLIRLGPEILILEEFRNNENGFRIRSELLQEGYIHQMVTGPHGNDNSIFLASFEPFNGRIFPELNEHMNKVIRAEFENDLVVYGMYFPLKQKKEILFKFMLERIEEEREKRVLFMGDLNTGKHLLDEDGSTFYCSEYFDNMEEAGLIDIWRYKHGDKREYTWYSNSGNGFRIDHAFGNEVLLRSVKKVKYNHEVRERGVSDHSILMLEMKERD